MATDDSKQVPDSKKTRERRNFSNSFKLKAVLRAQDGAHTLTEVANSLKLARSVLQRWVREAKAGKIAGYKGAPERARAPNTAPDIKKKAIKMLARGLQSREVAKRLNVDVQYIYKWAHTARQKGLLNGAAPPTRRAAPVRREAPAPMIDPSKFRDAVGMLKHAVEAMPAAARMDEAHALTLTAYRMLLS